MKLTSACVVPYYDASVTIASCYKSLITQTHEFDQIILVNDGCRKTDKSLLKYFEDEDWEKLVWVCLPRNKGASAARNFGLDLAETALITFCDSDESLDPRKNEWQVDMFSDRKIDLVCFRDITGDQPSLSGNVLDVPYLETLSFRHFIFKNPVILSSVCMRSSLNARFDETLICAEDLDLWLRLSLEQDVAISRCNLGSVHPILGRYHAKGLSSQTVVMFKSLVKIYSKLAISSDLELITRILSVVGLIFVPVRVAVGRLKRLI